MLGNKVLCRSPSESCGVSALFIRPNLVMIYVQNFACRDRTLRKVVPFNERECSAHILAYENDHWGYKNGLVLSSHQITIA
jgi:hypothetical protein